MPALRSAVQKQLLQCDAREAMTAPGAHCSLQIIMLGRLWSPVIYFCIILGQGLTEEVNQTTSSYSTLPNTTEPPLTDTSSLLTSVLVPLLVCFVLILLGGYLLRSRKSRKADVNSGDKKIPNGILEEQEQQRVMLLSSSPTVLKKYFPIPVEHLEEEVRIRSADDGKLFREEYNSLQSGNFQGTFEVANREEIKEKNRYPNILPCKSHL